MFVINQVMVSIDFNSISFPTIGSREPKIVLPSHQCQNIFLKPSFFKVNGRF